MTDYVANYWKTDQIAPDVLKDMFQETVDQVSHKELQQMKGFLEIKGSQLFTTQIFQDSQVELQCVGK